MKVGYARTSSADQVAGFEAQLEELRTAGCEKLFHEQVSSIAKRHQLQAHCYGSCDQVPLRKQFKFYLT